MSTHPADFAKQMEQSNWFNRMRDADMTRQEQTARPQDVALLPLPEIRALTAYAESGQELRVVSPAMAQQYASDYARACVTAALASAQAREEELRALLREAQPFIGWTGSYTELHAKIDAALSTNAATQTGERNG